MPYFETSDEWYEQSSLLIKARPTSARVTSKYTVLKPTPSKIKKREKYLVKHPNTASASDSTAVPPTLANSEAPTATFLLKTYDPVSGTCLQYETNKAAEVGRLIGNLSRLGRHMAALPEIKEDQSAAAAGEDIATPSLEGQIKLEDTSEQKPSGGGGGKKKKKGKK
ncbi:hypothetical protein EJ04DRAFT_489833 [Polyplosphaeria fusca]|uniref:SRP9 domain-containing protein n=1 Tax=Polyplosphaeria fusca TaxID=682080 RepID=A0A9P4R0W1_9PLEO|nr:hypothetical protein EJ04DRAFT_489833 [Polyplosphaeria fusca]